jgi:hypothetical protein
VTSRQKDAALIVSVCGLFVVGALLVWGCAGGQGVPSTVDVTTMGAAEIACVEAADARPTADACRTAVKAAFCKSWPSLVTCGDAGGE